MTADPRVEVVARALLDVSEAWPRTGDALDDAYARMCVPCHRRYDAARRRLTGERTSPRRGGGGDV